MGTFAQGIRAANAQRDAQERATPDWYNNVWDAYRYTPQAQVAGAVLRSAPVAKLADWLNRGLFARTAYEREFMPEARALTAKAEEDTPYHAYRGTLSSPIGSWAWHMAPQVGMLAGMEAAAGTEENPLLRAIKAAGRGLSGRERQFSSDVRAAHLGPPETATDRILRGTGGFVEDLVEPMTLVDILTPTPKGQVARAMGNLAPDLASQAAKKQTALLSIAGKPVIYGEKALKPVSQLADILRGMRPGHWWAGAFQRGGGHPALRKKVIEHTHGAEMMAGEARVARRKLEKTIAEIAERHGLDYEQAARYIDEIAERGDVTGTVLHRAKRELDWQQSLDMEVAPEFGARQLPGDVTTPVAQGIDEFPWHEAPGERIRLDPHGRTIGDEAAQPVYPTLEAARELTPDGRPRLSRLGPEDPTAAGRRPLPPPEAPAAPSLPQLPQEYWPTGKRTPRRRMSPPQHGPLFEAGQRVKSLEEAPRRLRQQIIEEVSEEFFDEAADIADNMGKYFETELSAAQMRNLTLRQIAEDIGYLPHLLSEELRAVLRKFTARGPFRRWSLKHSNMMERLLTKDVSINQFEQIVRNAELGGLNYFIDDLNKTGQIITVSRGLETDPATLRYVYGMRQARVKATADLLDDIKKMPQALNIDDVPLAERGTKLAGMRELQGSPTLQDAFKGYYFEDDLAYWIERTVDEIVQPTFPKDFTRFFDTGQNWWKAWTLAVFPSYHTRNVVGNLVNAWHAGTRDPMVFHDAARLEMAIWEPTSEFGKRFKDRTTRFLDATGVGAIDDVSRKYGFQDFNHLYAETERRGILGFGFFGSGGEVVRGVGDYMHLSDLPGMRRLEGTRVGQFRPGIAFGGQSVPIKGGRTVGSILENNARWGVFLDQTRKLNAMGVPIGLAADDAAWTVKRFLFDYSDAGVTAFERQTMKRIMPFYTWTRNNLPLQLEMLVKHPGRFGALEKARHAFGEISGPGPDETYMPDWLAQLYPWRVGQAFFPMERYLPQAEIGRFWPPTDAGRELFSMLSPAFTVPFEQAIGRSVYFDRELDTPYWPEVVGVQMPGRAAHVARTLRPVSEATWMMKPQEEYPTGAKLLRLLMGKSYTYDPDDAKSRELYELNKEIQRYAKLLGRRDISEFDRRRWTRKRDQLIAEFNEKQRQ